MGRLHQRVDGLEWNTLRKDENREEWRMLVVKPTVVPQLSARLRDRQDKIRRRNNLQTMFWMCISVVSIR